MGGSINLNSCVFLCMYVRWSVSLSVCQFTCPSVCISFCPYNAWAIFRQHPPQKTGKFGTITEMGEDFILQKCSNFNLVILKTRGVGIFQKYLN